MSSIEVASWSLLGDWFDICRSVEKCERMAMVGASMVNFLPDQYFSSALKTFLFRLFLPEENLKLLDLHDEMQLAVKYQYEHHL